MEGYFFFTKNSTLLLIEIIFKYKIINFKILFTTHLSG